MVKLGEILRKPFRIIEMICIIFICAAFLFNAFLFICNSHILLLPFFYTCFCLVWAALTYILRHTLIKSNTKVRVIFVMLIAFFIRSVACIFLNVTQKGDYGIYLSVAQKLSSGNMEPLLYYGVFPHALNYPIFISAFYKLLGVVSWLPRAINLIFGVAEVGFAVVVAEKSIGPRFGLLAGIAIALNPSIILFTLFAGGEPLYGSLIMAALFCYVNALTKKLGPQMAWAAAAGMVCALGDFFRPTGIIFIVAVLLQLFLFEKTPGKARLYISSVLVSSFVVIAFILGLVTCSVSGYKKSSPSFGWNLFVGANKESKGQWNTADGALFNEIIKKYDDPSQIQSYFAQLGMERYYKMNIEIPKHWFDKLNVWFDESFVSGAVVNWQDEYTRFKSSDIAQIYKLICLSYNFIVVLAALAAMLSAVFSKAVSGGFKVASLYFLGSIIVFSVFENASRYKGAFYGILTLLAAYGIFTISRTLRSLHRKDHFIKQPIFMLKSLSRSSGPSTPITIEKA